MDNVGKLLRTSIRPLVTLLLTGATVYMAVSGNEAGIVSLSGLTGSVVGYWFAERRVSDVDQVTTAHDGAVTVYATDNTER